jgi:hypothetical protein
VGETNAFVEIAPGILLFSSEGHNTYLNAWDFTKGNSAIIRDIRFNSGVNVISEIKGGNIVVGDSKGHLAILCLKEQKWQHYFRYVFLGVCDPSSDFFGVVAEIIVELVRLAFVYFAL